MKEKRKDCECVADGVISDEEWQKIRDEEFKGTIEGLVHDFPGTVDYHTEDGEWFQLLDKDDAVIAVICERELMAHMA